MNKLTPKEIENAKQMIVNQKVAKTMDRKTQTRRLIPNHLEISKFEKERGLISWKINGFKTPNSYGVDEFIDDFAKHKIDDILWVREPVKVLIGGDYAEHMTVNYLSDNTTRNFVVPNRFRNPTSKWIKNAQGIPNGCIREMARTFVKITNVRVERLQDIDSDDIMSEGFSVDYEMQDTTKKYSIDDKGEVDFFDDLSMEWWINLWNLTAPKGFQWEDNPYVFVYEFERIEK